MASIKKEGTTLVAQERLFLDVSQSKLIAEGDTRAAFLLAGKGCVIPAPIAKRLKLDETSKPEPVQKPIKPAVKGTEPATRSTRPAAPEATR